MSIGLDRAALTPTQRDIHLDERLAQASYRIACTVPLGPGVDPEAWQSAVRAVCAAEPLMRTRIEEGPEGLAQRVDEDTTIELRYDEAFAGDPQDPGGPLRRWLTEEPATPAVFRHVLARTPDGEFHAGVGGPHVVWDGQSHRVFFKRVARAYSGAPESPGPDFYDYMREAAPPADDEASVALWRARLDGLEPLRFGTRTEAPGEFGRQVVTLSQEETDAIDGFCGESGVRAPTFFMALHALLLQRYREPAGDLLVHAIRGSRPPRFANTIGCFYSVLPYRLPTELLRSGAPLTGLFTHLRDYRRGLADHAEISMLELQGLLPPGGNRLVFNFYDFEPVGLLGHERTIEAFDTVDRDEVQLIVGRRDGRYELRHLFHTSVLGAARIAERLRRLALQAAAGAERIGDLDGLFAGERDEHVAVPRIDTPQVHERFEAHAARTPAAVALVAGERHVTYGELNEHANRVARALVAQGVGPGTLVGLRLERQAEQVAAILAVLKAGGAYVPIDVDYPDARTRLILESSGAEHLLTDAVVASFTDGDSSNLDPRAEPHDLAYVIYTSGSTGRPKGVMVTRRNVARLFDATASDFGFGARDTWPLLHSYAFDFSVWEIWGALAFGGRLLLVPREAARDPAALRDLLAREGATVLNQTPSAFYRFMEEEARQEGKLEGLRLVVFGGEALDVPRLRPWFDRYGDARPELVNMYGITETTVHVTARALRRADAEPGAPSAIGRPLADLRAYVLDPDGEPVPPGVAGELCVAGAGVSRGYLGEDELTAERFGDDPFVAGDRLYRSGDLARDLGGGELEYLGRIDDQVQVRGYRVELGEIESVLREHAAVADTAVAAGEDSLTAYVVAAAGAEVAEAELRDLLDERLPPYMSCARYVFLARLPLTVHGKVDRAALPDPGGERPDLEVGYAAPRSQAEEFVAGVFREVTGLERVGIDDDFFALGGNSLSVMQVLGRVREFLGLSLPLQALFEAPTVALFAEAMESGRFADAGVLGPRPVRGTQQGDAPLTLAQERVWLIQQLAPEAVAYQFEAGIRFRGELRAELLERCLHELVDRHEVLRTTFPAVGGRPVQRVHDAGLVELAHVSFAHLGAEGAAAELERQRRAGSGETFSLDELPLIRWTLVELAPDEHVLLHREHHLLHDGWSFVVLMGELLQLYRALLAGDPTPLPEPTLRLRDFARAEREWLGGPGAERQLGYWRGQLAGAPPMLELPADRARPARPSYAGESLRLDVAEDVVRSLRAVAREQGVTLFAAMLGAFAVLLSRLSGECDLCIGSGVANRTSPEVESLVGMLLNNVVLRLDLGAEPTFASVLKRAQRVVLEALANQDLPYDRVARMVECPVFFSSYDGPIPHVPIPGLAVDVQAGLPNGSAKFDLNVIVVAEGEDAYSPAEGDARDRVTLIWEFSTELFERETMERLAQDYVALLGAVGDADLAWRDLSLESESAALGLARPPESTYPRDSSIPDLWGEQAASSPAAVAVRDADGEWTYAELDAESNRVAHALRERGVEPDELVGLCLPRGRAAVAGMLGILKAGAAYLPLDPAQPPARIAWLAGDSGIRLAIASAGSEPALAGCADLEALTELAAQPDAPLPRLATADSLAYVMYTSGSTGAPKGVETPHRGVVRLLFGMDYARLDAGTRILQLAPLSFDASTFEIWGVLLHGGTLAIHPEDMPGAGALGAALTEHGIDTMWLSASLFNALVDQDASALRPLRQLLIGGEALSVDHVRRAYAALPGTQIINGYGPTENTTFSACHAIPREMPEGTPSVPLGRPIAHSSVYVLDERLRPVPWGGVGEIHLGGDGLARGYRGRPDLTAERFVADPRSAGERLYRSGDFGRFRSDGTLEFRGRRDDQVKIRGFRIEPAEVEWALGRLGGVRQSAVVSHRAEGGPPQLVAYVVPEPGVELDEIRAEARRQLPGHLVPQHFMTVASLPRSPHGKLDRQALPAPADIRAALSPPPATVREAVVAGVMADVLGVEEVGRDDQFFDLGGHSLLGLELLERIARVLGVTLPASALMENSTVAGLAALIDGEEEAGAVNGDPRSLVRIKPGGSRPPVFFSPGGDGAEGALLVYARLARFFGPDQPFYGLKAREDGAHRSVEEMASAYLAEVRELQPHGPYVFAGECVGGVIAYEMARQAREAGHEVGHLVLLDSRPPRLASHARTWGRILSSRARRRGDELVELAAGRPRAVRLRRRLDERLPYDDMEAPASISRAWIGYQRTLLRYKPPPYEGKLTLLLSDHYAEEDVAAEWEPLVGGLDLKRAPGNHDSYIRLRARETARIFESCLYGD